MKNQPNQYRVIELDLKEILWALLTQWKAVLIVAIMMAVLMCSVKYAKDLKAYDAKLDASGENDLLLDMSEDEKINYIRDSLSDEDNEVIELVLREEEWLSRQRDYLNNSILMNLDPTNLRELKITYDIDGDDAGDLPVLLESFNLYLLSDEYLNEIGKAIDESAKTKYIGELVEIESDTGPQTAEGQTALMINISIIIPEGINPEDVVKVSDKAIKEFSSDMQGRYTHKLTIAATALTNGYDYNVTNRFKETYDRINGVYAAITNAKNTMNDEQKAAYDAIETILSGGLAEKEDNVVDASNNNGVESAAPSWSKKYMVLGFMLGILLYGFVYTAILIMRGCICSAASIGIYTGLRLLGKVYYESDAKGLSKLLHSKVVEKYHYKDEGDVDSQIDKTVEALNATCEHKEVRNLILLDLTDPKKPNKEKDIINSVIDKADKNEIIIKNIDVAVEPEEKNLLDVENAVIAVSLNTKISALDKIVSLCEEYDVNIMGSIYTAAK